MLREQRQGDEQRRERNQHTQGEDIEQQGAEREHNIVSHNRSHAMGNVVQPHQ